VLVAVDAEDAVVYRISLVDLDFFVSVKYCIFLPFCCYNDIFLSTLLVLNSFDKLL